MHLPAAVWWDFILSRILSPVSPNRGRPLISLARVNMNTNGKVVFHGIGPGPRGYLDGFFDRFTKPKLRVRGCNCKHACLITFFEIKRKGDSVTRVDGKSSVKNCRIIRIILSPRRDRGAERGERRNVSYCFQNVSPSKLKLRVLLERSSQFFLTFPPTEYTKQM